MRLTPHHPRGDRMFIDRERESPADRTSLSGLRPRTFEYSRLMTPLVEAEEYGAGSGPVMSRTPELRLIRSMSCGGTE